MDGSWDFLDPWRSALCARLLAHEPKRRGYTLNMMLITPYPPDVDEDNATRYPVLMEIPVDATAPTEPQLLREAIELFTLLFKVDGTKFRELLSEDLPQLSAQHHLVWDLWPVGVLSQVNKPPTWGALFGFMDTSSSVLSSQFRSAMQKLETMGKTEVGDFRGSELHWTCRFPAAQIQGWQALGESEDSKLTSLLNLGAPPVVEQLVRQVETTVAPASKRLRLERNKSTPAGDSTSFPSTLCQYIMTRGLNFAESRGFTEMLAALARNPMSTLTLFIADDYEDRELDSAAVVENGGFALNALLRGRLVCQLAEEFRSSMTFARYKTCDLSSSSVTDGVFAAICSTIAELPSDKPLNSLEVYTTNLVRWVWLFYMLCCGSSVVGLQELSMISASLTKADVAAMREALKRRYPRYTSPQVSPEYGFVSIPKGATLWSVRTPHVEGSNLITAEALTCRARRCPVITSQCVEAVVPGYGVCLTNVGDGAASFERDASELTHQSHTQCRLRSLRMHMSRIELDTLLLDLLGFIGGELRTLSIQLDESDPDEEYDTEHVADIDLCALAAVCPKLEVLQLVCFDVVVQSASNDALSKWPIKKMNIINSEHLPNLGPYLSNPATRMARGLTELRASRLDGEEFAGEERNVLEAHDRECLPITKEKFPTEAKIALLSTMGGSGAASGPGGNQPTVRHLDANTLSIIFKFAATPVQRSVRCTGWHGYYTYQELS